MFTQQQSNACLSSLHRCNNIQYCLFDTLITLVCWDKRATETAIRQPLCLHTSLCSCVAYQRKSNTSSKEFDSSSKAVFSEK